MGQLWIVPTPIGNLEDITIRALRVLNEVDVILAEDTRHTRKLCAAHGIKTPLCALHAHSDERTVARYVERLVQGENLALVSDAGTPMISDPGAALVQAATRADVPVHALPGASAVTTALSVSGVPFDAFRFIGFLPRTGARRKRALEVLADAPEPTVLFEAPRRLHGTLLDLIAVAGPDRGVAVCRELTKAHEEVVRGPAQQVAAHFAEGVLGEVTVVVERCPSVDESPNEEGLEAIIVQRLASGESARDIARKLAGQFSLPRRRLYQQVLEVAGRPSSELPAGGRGDVERE